MSEIWARVTSRLSDREVIECVFQHAPFRPEKQTAQRLAFGLHESLEFPNRSVPVHGYLIKVLDKMIKELYEYSQLT